ncbi:10165_t:CDS:2 [Gigaspora margarita]|uniref:10165_t:CDS:1 n=1 Tax=Gigaspora margarita TaxID=4874 RepID=A0ABN7V051_GIGMA|nr:10165_t:CDS:2 [Gigaspora margarita]
MANNSQHTSSTHSQNLQYNNISMSIQPQSQLKDKIQQNAMDEKKQKKVIQHGHKRKLMENERDKQKAELESSKNELKSLMSQFGTKAKVADDLERDSTLLRGNIESLLARVRSNKISKKSHHTYLYIEPYEPVVHGTFGVDQPASLGIMWSIVNSVKDFFAEVINGGRGFGNPNYDGFVPI